MHNPLLQQLKKRRRQLGYKQKDMMSRIGVSRQQYQHIEAKGNPRLNTLELIAKGLNSALMLIPNEKLSAVQAILKDNASENKPKKDWSEDPWQGLLGEDEE